MMAGIISALIGFVLCLAVYPIDYKQYFYFFYFLNAIWGLSFGFGYLCSQIIIFETQPSNLTGFIAGVKFLVRCIIASIAVFIIGLLSNNLEYLWYVQSICFGTACICLILISLFLSHT